MRSLELLDSSFCLDENKLVDKNIMEHEVRELINRNNSEFYEKYFKKNRDAWNILCSSMDTIGDTTLAIECFKKNGIGNVNGEQYLKLYGILQAIYLQQDAIYFLFKVIKESFDSENKINDWKKYKLDSWKLLRSYRNLSSGHPIENTSFEKGTTKRTIISRVTISSKGFELLVFDQNKTSHDFPYVNLSDLISSYLSEAKVIISDLETFLNNYEF